MRHTGSEGEGERVRVRVRVGPPPQHPISRFVLCCAYVGAIQPGARGRVHDRARVREGAWAGCDPGGRDATRLVACGKDCGHVPLPCRCRSRRRTALEIHVDLRYTITSFVTGIDTEGEKSRNCSA